MKLIIKLSLLLLFCLPINVLAEIPEQLKKDFAPIRGTIIMPLDGEYLIDLDVSSNLHEGDILTLIRPGEKIIHPVTKKVIGTLDIAKGYLQVTQIKSGYSYAKLLSTNITPAKSDQVKRFEQVPALFETTRAENNLTGKLKTGLSHLHWLNSTDNTRPELFFTLTGNNLAVKNSAGTILKTYQYIDGKLLAPLPATNQADIFSFPGMPEQNKSFLKKTIDNLLDNVGLGKKDKRL
jgi:hypothetical protein